MWLTRRRPRRSARTPRWRPVWCHRQDAGRSLPLRAGQNHPIPPAHGHQSPGSPHSHIHRAPTLVDPARTAGRIEAAAVSTGASEGTEADLRVRAFYAGSLGVARAKLNRVPVVHGSHRRLDTAVAQHPALSFSGVICDTLGEELPCGRITSTPEVSSGNLSRSLPLSERDAFRRAKGT